MGNIVREPFIFLMEAFLNILFMFMFIGIVATIAAMIWVCFQI